MRYECRHMTGGGWMDMQVLPELCGSLRRAKTVSIAFALVCHKLEDVIAYNKNVVCAMGTACQMDMGD